MSILQAQLIHLKQVLITYKMCAHAQLHTFLPQVVSQTFNIYKLKWDDRQYLLIELSMRLKTSSVQEKVLTKIHVL